MTLAAKKPASYQDILQLPSNVRGEILLGELVVSPRPSPIHQKAMAEMTIGLGSKRGGGEGSGEGWIFLTEPELHLEDQIVVPDIAAWRVGRVSPEFYSRASISLLPDWVCEIQSPSTARLDRVTKRRVYLNLKIPYYWLIDPIAHTLEALKATPSQWLVMASCGGNERVRVEPFEDMELDLQTFWAPEAEPTQG